MLVTIIQPPGVSKNTTRTLNYHKSSKMEMDTNSIHLHVCVCVSIYYVLHSALYKLMMFLYQHSNSTQKFTTLHASICSKNFPRFLGHYFCSINWLIIHHVLYYALHKRHLCLCDYYCPSVIYHTLCTPLSYTCVPLPVHLFNNVSQHTMYLTMLSTGCLCSHATTAVDCTISPYTMCPAILSTSCLFLFAHHCHSIRCLNIYYVPCYALHKLPIFLCYYRCSIQCLTIHYVPCYALHKLPVFFCHNISTIQGCTWW